MTSGARISAARAPKSLCLYRADLNATKFEEKNHSDLAILDPLKRKKLTPAPSRLAQAFPPA